MYSVHCSGANEALIGCINTTLSIRVCIVWLLHKYFHCSEFCACNVWNGVLHSNDGWNNNIILKDLLVKLITSSYITSLLCLGASSLLQLN